MLDANLTQQLQTYLANLREPIELVASLDDGEVSAKTRDLLEQIAALSERSQVERQEKGRRVQADQARQTGQHRYFRRWRPPDGFGSL